jgi:ATP-binding cassette, subfamily B, bacterial MsbA
MPPLLGYMGSMLKGLLQKLFPDQDALRLVKRLALEQGAPHWQRYAFAFAFMGVAAACTGATAYLVGTAINAAYLERNFPAIVVLGFGLATLFLVKGLATYGHSVLLMRIANRIVADNRKRLFDKLINQGMGYFSDKHSSGFTVVLQTGASAAANALNIMVLAMGRDMMTLISLIIVMIIQDPFMSLIALGIAPPAIFVLRRLIKRVRTVYLTEFGGAMRVIETLQETLQGMRIVKAFTLEQSMRSRFNHHVDDVERASNKLARVQNRASPLMEALGGMAVATAFIYGGYRVVQGAAPGEFVSFVTAFLLAYEPAKRLARVNLDLTGALVGTRILFDVIDTPASEPIEDGKPPLALAAGRVEFRSVSFAYRPNEPVLREVSFVAEPGKVTALVGVSGGGKSTILNLIWGLYEVGSGAILIDGQEIGQVSRQSLRRQIAYVGQDVFLFGGTIRENIACGRPDATEEEVVAAAKAANAHNFIMSFPNGYDALVGEHGLALSGGQRQRISIARALIRDAAIILLDEATASLDSESEREVQAAIERLCVSRTTIMIAHRLHTITHANCIYVIEQGSVVESGRHSVLLQKSGRYASLYYSQGREQAAESRQEAVETTA